MVYGGIATAGAGGKTTPATTFKGSCQLSGRVTFRPGLSNTPRTVYQSVSAPGTCDGTFRDRYGFTHQLNRARVTFSETSVGRNASCAAGIATGSGSLRFHWGKLRFAFAERRVGAFVNATGTGTRGGSATGYGAPSPSENPVGLVQQCGGSGIKQARVDIHLVTTPEISG
jgi:hypothetical protein